MLEQWPFDEPQNVAVFTVRQIVREGAPIHRVTHDSDDGAWQFLEWGTPREEDLMIVALRSIVRIDPSVAELADLPMGWRAWRPTEREPWIREPNPHQNDEEVT
jgi:hypothetical protein